MPNQSMNACMLNIVLSNIRLLMKLQQEVNAQSMNECITLNVPYTFICNRMSTRASGIYTGTRQTSGTFRVLRKSLATISWIGPRCDRIAIDRAIAVDRITTITRWRLIMNRRRSRWIHPNQSPSH